MAEQDAEKALHALQGELGNWTAVGRYVAAKVGGRPASWTATANAVANGKRKPPHLLLVALGLRQPRRRLSLDIPAWMDKNDEAAFRARMRETAVVIAAEVQRGR